jgi:hypothetical protein
VSAHAQKGPCFFRTGRFRPPAPVARITRRACRLTYADFVKASQASRLALPPNNLNAAFTPKLVALGSTRAAHRAGRHSAWVEEALLALHDDIDRQVVERRMMSALGH